MTLLETHLVNEQLTHLHVKLIKYFQVIVLKLLLQMIIILNLEVLVLVLEEIQVPGFWRKYRSSFGGNTGPSFGGSTGPSFEGFDNNAFFDDNEFVESSPDDEFNDFGVNNNSDFSEIEGDEVDDVAEFGKLVNFERDNDAQFGGNQIKSSNSGGDAIPHKNQSAENETFKDLQKEVNSNSQDFGSKIEEAFEDGKISEKQKNTLYDEKIKNIMDKSKQKKKSWLLKKKNYKEVAKTRKALIANNLANTAIRKGVEDERGFAKFLIDNDYLPAVDDMLKQVFDKFNEKLNEKLRVNPTKQLHPMFKGAGVKRRTNLNSFENRLKNQMKAREWPRLSWIK